MTEPRNAFTARGPVDLIAAVPYVLGFYPEDSVVLLTFGRGEAFHARVDLPVDGDAQLSVVEMLVEVVTRHGVDRVALLLYIDDAWVAAAFHDAAVPGFVRNGVDVIDVLRVGRDRFHSADDPDDPGTAYDLSTHVLTAEQVVAGTVVERSREDLAAGLDCADDLDARAVAESAVRFDERWVGLSAFVSVDRICRDLHDQARWVQRTIRRHVRRGTPLPVDDAGRMLVLMAGVPLRDVAWAEMSREDASGHLALWRDLVRRCPRDLLPGPSCLLAFAAWLSGQGALAWCALDRCVAVEPDHSMAACIGQLLEGAVPPSAWTPIAEEDLPAFWPPPDVEAS
jgi:hypothetical protein